MDPEEIGRKMDALGLWDAILPFNWAIKPTGTVFPYFCSAIKGDGTSVKIRFLMLEGWQTLHDFVRTRVDRNFGFYSTPMELAHFELVVLPDGTAKVYRHVPCFMPRELSENERTLAARILWEAFGVMMRIENERKLPLRYAAEKAMFARIETAPGHWEDAPMAIPDPRPHVEKISFAKSDISAAKDLPFANEESVEVDFRIMPTVMTREPRPRCAYALVVLDGTSGERVVFDRISPNPDGGLKALWEGVPARLLKHLIARGRIPGAIKVGSGRLFRMIRPLCEELPFRLSLHDSLPRLDEAFKV